MGLARADGMAAEVQAEFALTAESSAGKVIRKRRLLFGRTRSCNVNNKRPGDGSLSRQKTPATKRNTPGKSTEELCFADPGGNNLRGRLFQPHPGVKARASSTRKGGYNCFVDV